MTVVYVLAAGAAMAALAGGVLWELARRPAVSWVTPSRSPGSDTPIVPGAESLTLTTRDGLHLRAWLLRPERPAGPVPAVILLHGLSGNRDSMASRATLLTRLGYAALLLELRAHGASEGSFTTFGLDEVEDVRSATDALAKAPGIDGSRLGVLGLSLGAVVAVQAAAGLESVRAVVTEAVFLGPRAIAPAMIRGITGRPPIPSAGAVLWMMARHTGRPIDTIDLTTVSPRVRQPMLLMHGTADGIVPVEHSLTLARLSGGPSDVYVAEGGGHANLATFDAAEYERRLRTFLDTHLASNGSGTHQP